MSKLQSPGSVPGKETIYVDVDDEITGIIDKVQAAKGAVIALVLPKRATVLQSIVNMKLLKRTADDAGKNLVLITSEAGLMPLAGSVGLHVAATPTSKPTVPPAPFAPEEAAEDIDAPLQIVDGNNPEAADFNRDEAATRPVGELAAGVAAAKIAADDIDETIELGDEDASTPAAAGVAAALKPKKNKKLAVPNFDSFRKKLLLAGLVLVLLIAAWIFANTVLPHATVAVKTDTSTIPTSLNLTLDTTARSLDTTANIVPATAQSQKKTATQTASATGQQNNGSKATGSVKFNQQVCAPNLGQQPDDIPTGSSVSSGGNTYITQEDGSYSFVKFVGGNCAQYTTNSIAISALRGGSNYNTSQGAGFSGPGGASGTGSASGGTDNITKIVTQSDIDGAAAKLKSQDASAVKQQLASGLQSKGLQAVEATFAAGNPQVSSTVQAGQPGDSVTVTATTTYTMLGVHQADLKKLVDQNVNSQLDKGKQVILDDGVQNASFSAQQPPSSTGAQVSMSVKSIAGPQLSTGSIKQQAAGKKSGDIVSTLKQTPGVTDVQVHFSPFWVDTAPKNTGKIKVELSKPSTK